MSHSRLLTAAAAVLLATPLSVLAHDGHGSSVLAAFFMHPLSGLDHLAVIVAIGALTGLALASLALFVVGRAVGQLVAQLPRARARSVRLLMAVSLAACSGWFMAFGAS